MSVFHYGANSFRSQIHIFLFSVLGKVLLQRFTLDDKRSVGDHVALATIIMCVQFKSRPETNQIKSLYY